jgi:hypothetical protein
MQLTKQDKKDLNNLIGQVYSSVAISLGHHVDPYSKAEQEVLEGLKSQLAELRDFMGVK